MTHSQSNGLNPPTDKIKFAIHVAGDKIMVAAHIVTIGNITMLIQALVFKVKDRILELETNYCDTSLESEVDAATFDHACELLSGDLFNVQIAFDKQWNLVTATGLMDKHPEFREVLDGFSIGF